MRLGTVAAAVLSIFVAAHISLAALDEKYSPQFHYQTGLKTSAVLQSAYYVDEDLHVILLSEDGQQVLHGRREHVIEGDPDYGSLSGEFWMRPLNIEGPITSFFESVKVFFSYELHDYLVYISNTSGQSAIGRFGFNGGFPSAYNFTLLPSSLTYAKGSAFTFDNNKTIGIVGVQSGDKAGQFWLSTVHLEDNPVVAKESQNRFYWLTDGQVVNFDVFHHTSQKGINALAFISLKNSSLLPNPSGGSFYIRASVDPGNAKKLPSMVEVQDTIQFLDHGEAHNFAQVYLGVPYASTCQLIGIVGNGPASEDSFYTFPRIFQRHESYPTYYSQYFPVRELSGLVCHPVDYPLHMVYNGRPTTHAEWLPLQRLPCDDGKIDINHNLLYMEMSVRYRPSATQKAGKFALQFYNDDGEVLSIGYDPKDRRVFIDRSGLKGKTVLPKLLQATRHKYFNGEDAASWRVLIDTSVVEILVDDGLLSLTGVYYPEKVLYKSRVVLGANVEVDVKVFRLNTYYNANPQVVNDTEQPLIDILTPQVAYSKSGCSRLLCGTHVFMVVAVVAATLRSFLAFA